MRRQVCAFANVGAHIGAYLLKLIYAKAKKSYFKAKDSNNPTHLLKRIYLRPNTAI